MKNTFKILALGDVCGPRATEYLSKNLWAQRKKYGADLVIVNGENSAEPNGIDKNSAKMLFEAGADVITTGNHVFRKTSVFSYLDDEENILRPLNFPSECPGHGETIIKINGYKILVLNVMGQAYLDVGESPFEAVEKALLRNKGEYDFCVLDIHAEATGEKKAIAYNFADKIAVAFGTHTHVQTNDAQILNGSCAYVTDLGMCGAEDSILGVKKEAVIYKLKTKMLSKFDFAEGEIEAQGAIFEIDLNTFKPTGCELIKFKGETR
ncbi:MAG: YmdB family metallophosphoesterase [Clostridia bacterium]|nr:YmdB family metallophosphoesterase [Clostridia bacterium]